MSTSTIPATLAALEALWVPPAIAEDVQVIYGTRQAVTVTRDKALLIGEVDFSNDLADFGDNQDEAFTISCVAEVTLGAATDQHLAAAAVFDLYGSAVAAVRAQFPDETLGVPNLLYARVAGRGRLIHSTTEKVLKKGRGASIPFTITCLGVH